MYHVILLRKGIATYLYSQSLARDYRDYAYIVFMYFRIRHTGIPVGCSSVLEKWHFRLLRKALTTSIHMKFDLCSLISTTICHARST